MWFLNSVGKISCTYFSRRVSFENAELWFSKKVSKSKGIFWDHPVQSIIMSSVTVSSDNRGSENTCGWVNMNSLSSLANPALILSIVCCKRSRAVILLHWMFVEADYFPLPSRNTERCICSYQDSNEQPWWVCSVCSQIVVTFMYSLRCWPYLRKQLYGTAHCRSAWNLQ